MGLIEKLKKREQGIASFADSYGYFVYPKLTGPIKNRMFFNGQEVIVWSLNDYLGLSSDEHIVEYEKDLVAQYGMSYPGGSRLLSGNTEYHEVLEMKLSEQFQKQCMLLNLVYAGTSSILHSLLDRNDIVIYDQRVHASIMDGLKGHTGKRFSFRHNDATHLEAHLKRISDVRSPDTEVFVVVDGVYSMSGEIAPLIEIVKLKQKYDFTLIVDDSHGFLIFGRGGLPEHLGVLEDVDIYIASFGKALGNVGGFVAAKEEITSYFKYNLRSQIFGRSLSIVHVLSVLEKLRILENDSSRLHSLWDNTENLQSGFKKLGINLGTTKSPITPIMLRCDEDSARKIVITLREQFNVFCSGVVYPVIPKDLILLRLVVTASHTKQDIDLTLHAFAEIENTLKAEKKFQSMQV